jgi:sugar diacid utilization regulator
VAEVAEGGIERVAGSVSALIALALRDLDDNQLALAHAMAEETRRQVPEYGALSDDLVRVDLVPSLGRLLPVCLRALTDDASIDARGLEEIRQAAARRVRQDVAVSALLGCVRTAVRVGHEHIEDFLDREPASPTVAAARRELSRRIWNLLGTVAAEIAAAHDEAADSLATRRERSLAALGAVLLDGAFESNAALCAQARGVGVDLAGRHRLLLLVPARPVGGGEDVERLCAEIFTNRGEGLLVSRLDDNDPHVVAVVPERAAVATTRALARLYGGGGLQVVAAMLDAHGTPRDLQRAYARLRRCLGLLAWERPRLLRRAAVAVYLPLRSDMEAVAGCVREVLGAVLDRDDDGSLMQTLATYYGPGGASKARTAELLSVQARTVFNRLRRVKELTGLDPTLNGLVLALAVHLHEPYRRWVAAAGEPDDKLRTLRPRDAALRVAG